MKPIDHLEYVERATGRIHREPVFAASFLTWSYNTTAGRLATDLVFSRRWVSRLYGSLQRTRWSRRRIRPFVSRLEINLEEIDRPIAAFSSFEDFFTRRLDPVHRPVDKRPEACASPCDCRALVFPKVTANKTFCIKGSPFNLEALVDDARIARSYDGGGLFIGRIYLSDYHHFHFPVDCVPGPFRSIAGRYYAVSPYSRRRSVPFYLRNHRMVTALGTDTFAELLMIEIGAFTVGSVHEAYAADKSVEKGTHKGYFGLGGSTVVLIFKPGAIEFDRDLIDNSGRGLETYVRQGEPIGRLPADRDLLDRPLSRRASQAMSV